MASENAAQPSDDTYVIMVADCVVATDLAETVAEFSPQAHVIRKLTSTDVLATAAAVARIRVAFIDQSPQSFEQSVLSRLIEKKGGRVVFIGEEAEFAGCGAHRAVLNRPFSTPMVLALLARMLNRTA